PGRASRDRHGVAPAGRRGSTGPPDGSAVRSWLESSPVPPSSVSPRDQRIICHADHRGRSVVGLHLPWVALVETALPLGRRTGGGDQASDTHSPATIPCRSCEGSPWYLRSSPLCSR